MLQLDCTTSVAAFRVAQARDWKAVFTVESRATINTKQNEVRSVREELLITDPTNRAAPVGPIALGAYEHHGGIGYSQRISLVDGCDGW